MCAIALLRFGYDGLINDSENFFILKYFVPIWAVMLGYCGYGIAKRYYAEKTAILEKELRNLEKTEEWINRRRLIFSKAFKMIATITALVLPVYLIAFWNKFEFLNSNIPFMIILCTISVTCFILSFYLKNKYLKNLD